MPDSPYPYDPAKFVLPLEWQSKWPLPLTLWWILAGFGVAFAILDLSYCWVGSYFFPSHWSQLWAGLNYGAVGAQAGLLAIYAVFGPGRTWMRHIVAFFVGSCCLLTWLGGYGLAMAISDSGVPPYTSIEEVSASLLAVPALFLAGCFPLWVFRTLFRWRVERQISSEQLPRPPQLSIAGILAATFVVSLMLTLVRLGSYISQDYDEAAWWLGTGIGAAFTVGISLTTLPVCTWAVLRSRILAAGVTVAVVWVFLIGIGLVALISYLEGNWPPLEIWLNFIVLIASFIVFLLGPLLLCRFLHFRLVMGRQQPRTHAAVLSAEL